jgi:hypothetical protein
MPFDKNNEVKDIELGSKIKDKDCYPRLSAGIAMTV